MSFIVPAGFNYIYLLANAFDMRFDNYKVNPAVGMER